MATAANPSLQLRSLAVPPYNNRLQTDESKACREELGGRLATRSDTLTGNLRAGLAAEASVRYAA